MYLWRRSASPERWTQIKEGLRTATGHQLAIIERPNGRPLQLEVASKSLAKLRKLAKQFGGRVQKLPSDWLKRSLYHITKPLKIGDKRLMIPAGAAFGTGEHATTAMSLRLLQKLTRNWQPGWSIVDLGTGSGILALAAKCLSAGRVVGIDSDPMAISTAKSNARLNKIAGVEFRIADVRSWQFPQDADVVTANLFNELLVEILPKLKAAHWLILSGILREQERNVTRALKRNKIESIEARRSGKWVAILASVK
jgi:ribosomal protein L11 methyltransferase